MRFKERNCIFLRIYALTIAVVAFVPLTNGSRINKNQMDVDVFSALRNRRLGTLGNSQIDRSATGSILGQSAGDPGILKGGENGGKIGGEIGEENTGENGGGKVGDKDGDNDGDNGGKNSVDNGVDNSGGDNTGDNGGDNTGDNGGDNAVEQHREEENNDESHKSANINRGPYTGVKEGSGSSEMEVGATSSGSTNSGLSSGSGNGVGSNRVGSNGVGANSSGWSHGEGDNSGAVKKNDDTVVSSGGSRNDVPPSSTNSSSSSNSSLSTTLSGVDVANSSLSSHDVDSNTSTSAVVATDPSSTLTNSTLTNSTLTTLPEQRPLHTAKQEVVESDLCVDYSVDALTTPQGNESSSPHVLQGAIPCVGFTTMKKLHLLRKLKNITSLKNCAEKCCSEPTCNVALIHHMKCYFILCHNNSNENCLNPTTTKSHGSSTIFLRTPKNQGDQNETTPPLSTTTQLIIKPLLVSAGSNLIVQLPNEQCTLRASVKGQDLPKDLKYKWTLVSAKPTKEIGVMTGINTVNCTLTKLVAGEFIFQVEVSGDDRFGSAAVNVSVLKPLVKNEPPIAIVKPTSQKIEFPQDVIIDGEGSTDDKAIMSYTWEVVSGPIKSDDMYKNVDFKVDVLRINHLNPGYYQFKLMVKDEEGLENWTIANVTVMEETDYKPKANAGENKIIHLPTNHVKLYGNASEDDKGIVSYEWIKTAECSELAASMKGVRTSVLELSDLEVGDYKFVLMVTDTSGQSAEAVVRVLVKKATNTPPSADAGINRVEFLPIDGMVLNAENSTDDSKITSYIWSQTSGPENLKLSSFDRVIATTSKVTDVGVYTFKIKVEDSESLTDENSIEITVKKDINEPPVANAGDDLEITSGSVVTLDGSGSHDDHPIKSFRWFLDDSSLAAYKLISENLNQSKVMLTNLVVGEYKWWLEIIDDEGLVAKDSVKILVKPELNKNDTIEMHIDLNIQKFTKTIKNHLVGNILLLLHRDANQIKITDVSENIDSTMKVSFYIKRSKSLNDTGFLLANDLRNKLAKNAELFDYRILALDTKVCQNNCSGHGYCNHITKKCICETFWMQDFISAYKSLPILYSNSNCDWSILYFIIIIVFMIVFFILSIITLRFFCQRSQRKHTLPKRYHKRRSKYSMLKNRDKSSSDKSLEKFVLDISTSECDSDASDEETTLFHKSRKKPNGHAKPTIKPLILVDDSDETVSML